MHLMAMYVMCSKKEPVYCDFALACFIVPVAAPTMEAVGGSGWVCCPVRCSAGMAKNHPTCKKSQNNRDSSTFCTSNIFQLIPHQKNLKLPKWIQPPSPWLMKHLTGLMTWRRDRRDLTLGGPAAPPWWFFQSFLVKNGELVIHSGSLDCLQRVEDLPTIINNPATGQNIPM